MRKYAIILFLVTVFFPATALSQAPSATQVIEKAWDYMRGKTSVSVIRMKVHREDWERNSTIKAWTEGRENSIFKIIAPAKDKDNGTLKLGTEMWTYNPKINRIVKIPPSMMSQSWMGSDFSNNDLSKADSILNDYTHKIASTKKENGHTIYTVVATPKPDAPVIWGQQTLTIRDDGILLAQVFHDEDLKVAKEMKTDRITELGGRPFPTRWTMRSSDAESDGDYTLLEYDSLSFDVPLKKNLFTLNALKKPLR